MLTYKYTARDPSTGNKVKAEVQADSEQAAAKLIRNEGLAPIEISAKDGNSGNGRYFNRVRTKDRIIFARQLSTLINAGLPLVQSLRSVTDQTTSKPLKLVGMQIITDVESGSTLAAALGKHPNVFNQVFVSLIAAGEASGTLDASLDRIALQQEKDAEIVSKVRSAMVYPAIVALVMLGVVTFMIVSVLPQVENLYDGLPQAGQLPLVTRVLLVISHFIIGYWWVVLLFVGFAVFMTTRYVNTLGGRRIMDRVKMKVWPVGPLFMKLYMARFARAGTTLVASGVPLIQMLTITADAVSNVHIQASLERAIEKVKGGKALSSTLEGDSNFLPLVPNMLKIGEQSGQIEQMLAKVADYYEKEVDNQIKTISTIIEPVMMIMLGIVALIIVAAVLLPIYSLVGKSGFSGR